MKNIKIFSILLLVLSTMLGCDDSFLDKEPLTQLSSSTFWQSEEDVKSALTGCYAPLTWGGGGYASALYAPAEWDGATDNGFSTYDYGGMQSLIKQGVNPNSGGFVPVLYEQSYRSIAAVNDFLSNIETVELEASTKNGYIAEALFLRAFFYYQLARTFGNVPLVVGAPQILDLQNPLGNSTKAEILAQVHQDLDFAITNLPDIAYGDGHAVKGSAQILKMHALLLENKFQDVVTLGSEVVNGGIFSLATDYDANFTKPGQNDNPEIMFSVKWNPPNSFFNPAPDLFLGVWQAVQPSQDLVDAYETINGLPIEDDPTFDAANPYENRDPRLKKTVFTPGDFWGNLVSPTNDAETFVPFERGDVTGFALKKFVTLPATTPPSYSTQGDQDWIIFRYADLLLMYAEALNETQGPSAEVYQSINSIRGRAGMPALSAGLSQVEMREKIQNERRIELAFENWRYFDLRRWNLAVEELDGSKVLAEQFQDNETPGKYLPIYDLWPIPQNVLNKNPNLEQNPGYN